MWFRANQMAEARLPEPEYIETPNMVRLILRNNIDQRTAYRNKASGKGGSGIILGLETIWDELDDVEKAIVTCMKENGKTSRSKLKKYTHKFRSTVINRLNKLLDQGIVNVNGDIHDPKRTYELV